MSRKVRVRVNQQQAEVIDRIVARGEHGESRAAVIRKGFLEFCRGRARGSKD
jgi:Arc/MetJ-type ribon-helix-helix transcriptional regulator